MVNKETEIKTIYKQDQFETEQTDWSSKVEIKKLEKAREKRLKQVKSLLKKGRIKTGGEFFMAAMIFHHSYGIENYATATMLSHVAMNKASKNGRWLYARAIDRLFLELGMPQKFGTQFEKIKGKWQLCDYDKKTTDKERAEFQVPTLKHQKEVRAKQLDEED